MAGGWGHALASAVGGWQKGANAIEDKKDRDEERAYRTEQRERARKKDREEDDLKSALKSASRPATVEEGADGFIKPATMDNRDVGLPENQDLPNQGLTAGGFAVQGKGFQDRAAADAAAQALNTPEAVGSRIAQTYREHGAPDKAMAMEASTRSAESAKIELADKRWKRDLGTAMRGGHDGLAGLASASEAGPMAGLQVKAVPSEDGKTVTYSAANKEGVFQPIPGLPQFSNDERGLTQAAFMLDRTIDPAARMTHYDAAEQRDRAQKNADRTFDAGERRADRLESQFERSYALQQTQSERAGRESDQRLARGAIELKDLENSAKVPAAVKLQVDGLRKEADGIATAMNKALAENTWDPASAGAKQLLERQAVVNAKISQHLQPYMKADTRGPADPFGLRKGGGASGGDGESISYKDPRWDAAEVVAAQKTGVPAEVMRTIRTVGERSNSDQVSPKGARTVYQFIPSTRAAILKKYGADAYSDDPAEQALATAYHLKESYDRTGSWDKAMAGFNGGITGEKGTNATTENKDYAARTSAALAAADPMDALYRKQVGEMNRGLRNELSPEVSAWKQRADTASARQGEQRFNAAQADYLQKEKLKAQRDSKALATTARG